MDPEQTFLRVHARLSSVLARLLTPKFRAGLEYLCILNAVMLLSLLVVMHVNFVAQPGCAEHFTDSELSGAQLIQIKITGSWNRFTEEALGRGMWMHETSRQQFSSNKQNRGQSETEERYQSPGVVDDGWNILAAKFWLNLLGTNARRTKLVSIENIREIGRDDYTTVAETGMEKGIKPGWQSGKEESFGLEVTNRPMSGPGRGPLGTALLHYLTRWSSYGAACFKRAEQSARSFWQVWRITGWEPFTNVPKGDRRTVAWNKLDSVLVDLPENRSTMFDPTYLYSIEKGYLMMSESAKLRHNVKTVNVSISAQHSCFGNRWQQLLIGNFVGYDTILMNSLLSACGRGYLYNFQTKELHNLNYLQEFGRVSNGIEDRKKPNLPAQKLPGLLQPVADYFVFKCGVLITSLFVFFTTTMSVSFTLRETQARMLKFTVQLQHHARHRLPTYRLIFIHVVESLVFVPIMIGILFFLFEFFDDQLLAFMVLTLVWLCELFTMISVRTPLSVQFFPWFFFLYFMVFHIYFFSYTYGFSYLAFSATAAFMQHLVLYFWNRYEVPALQNFLQRRALLQEQGVQITSSSILTSTVQVTRASNTNMSSQIIRGVAGLNNLRVGSADGPTGLRSSLTSSGPGTPSRSRGPSTPQDVTVDLASNTSSNSDVNTNLPNGAGFEPLGRGWINSSIHDTDNIWRRSIELDRLRRDTEREALFREHGRDTGMGPGFGVQPTGDGQTPSPLRPTPPFSPYGSVLPWILGSPSLFLPVFHGLGNDSPGSQNNEEHGDLDTPTITNSRNSTTPDTVVAEAPEAPEATEGGLRNRHVGHSLEEGQTP